MRSGTVRYMDVDGIAWHGWHGVVGRYVDGCMYGRYIRVGRHGLVRYGIMYGIMYGMPGQPGSPVSVRLVSYPHLKAGPPCSYR